MVKQLQNNSPALHKTRPRHQRLLVCLRVSHSIPGRAAQGLSFIAPLGSPTLLLNLMDTDVPTLDQIGTPILCENRQSIFDDLERPHPAGQTLDTTSPISSVDFDNAMTSTIAMAEREKRDPSKPFKENHFSIIRDLLDRVGKHRWSERPRTYLVLRMIDQVRAMDGFVLEGLRDIHFPYTEERLPGCLANPSSRYAFLEKQSLVMSSRAADLVCRGPHRHLSKIWFSRSFLPV